MNVMARTLFVSIILVGLSLTTDRPVRGQEGRAAVEPVHFHHVHLNSVNPTAAAEYYPKPFGASAMKTSFNGYEAVKTGNLYLLFTKIHPWGNTRAAMIEGPDRIAIELVEVK